MNTPCLLAVVSTVDEILYLDAQLQIWTRPAGAVKKVDYGNSENMSAIIAPAGASSITLQFTAFQTELNYDFLAVKSCTSIDCVQTSLLGRYSGETIPRPLTSNTGIMLILWTSDQVTTESGWSASWSSVIVGGIYSTNIPYEHKCHLAFGLQWITTSVTLAMNLPSPPPPLVTGA